ncbi:hypothetical protein AB3S75_030795 [Citrus x aurantiifolia]
MMYYMEFSGAILLASSIFLCFSSFSTAVLIVFSLLNVVTLACRMQIPCRRWLCYLITPGDELNLAEELTRLEPDGLDLLFVSLDLRFTEYYCNDMHFLANFKFVECKELLPHGYGIDPLTIWPWS